MLVILHFIILGIYNTCYTIYLFYLLIQAVTVSVTVTLTVVVAVVTFHKSESPDRLYWCPILCPFNGWQLHGRFIFVNLLAHSSKGGELTPLWSLQVCWCLLESLRLFLLSIFILLLKQFEIYLFYLTKPISQSAPTTINEFYLCYAEYCIPFNIW